VSMASKVSVGKWGEKTGLPPDCCHHLCHHHLWHCLTMLSPTACSTRTMINVSSWTRCGVGWQGMAGDWRLAGDWVSVGRYRTPIQGNE
jgi:hypothetical protein